MKRLRKTSVAPMLAVAGVVALSACAMKEAGKPAEPVKPAPAAAAPAPVTPAAAAVMANNCLTCHGPRGVSPGSMPSLHGKTEGFLSGALKDFRSGARPSTVMGRHAKGYTDAEIEAIAKYISSLK